MKINVLLVDDDDSFRELIHYQFSKEKCHILTAKGGLETLDIFIRFKPDVIISDINMPEMNGLQLLKKIREISKETIFIIMTAGGTVKSAVEAIRMMGMVHQPFSIQDMVFSLKDGLPGPHKIDIIKVKRASGSGNGQQWPNAANFILAPQIRGERV